MREKERERERRLKGGRERRKRRRKTKFLYETGEKLQIMNRIGRKNKRSLWCWQQPRLLVTIEWEATNTMTGWKIVQNDETVLKQLPSPRMTRSCILKCIQSPSCQRRGMRQEPAVTWALILSKVCELFLLDESCLMMPIQEIRSHFLCKLLQGPADYWKCK